MRKRILLVLEGNGGMEERKEGRKARLDSAKIESFRESWSPLEEVGGAGNGRNARRGNTN